MVQRNGTVPARGAPPNGPALRCPGAVLRAGAAGIARTRHHAVRLRPLPGVGWGISPGPCAVVCRSGRIRGSLSAEPAGKVAGGCCRLGKGCRENLNFSATSWGRRGPGTAAPPGLRAYPDEEHPAAPSHSGHCHRRSRPPALLLFLGSETKSPSRRRA